jgi:hypothetical protein
MTGHAHYGEGHAPSDTYTTLIFNWTTTNSDSVFIVDPAGRIERPTNPIELPINSYIFFAQGPGGIAVVPTGGFETYKPGPGLDGLIYDFHDFNPSLFDKFGYKTQITVKRNLESLIADTISYLQSIGYNASTASSPAFTDGTFIYTPNFNDPESIHQTPDDLRSNGELRRQAALIIMIRPHKMATQAGVYELTVLAIVQRNRPRQDNKWINDPDGFQLSIPLCKSIADAIAEKG